MKNLGLSLLSVAALFLASCSSDDNGGDSMEETGLNGKVTADVTLDASVAYELTGAYIVESGATLTIPAGTKITADAGGIGVTDILLLIIGTPYSASIFSAVETRFPAFNIILSYILSRAILLSWLIQSNRDIPIVIVLISKC